MFIFLHANQIYYSRKTALHSIQKRLFILLLFTSIFSCNTFKKEECKSGWIGGEIVNPKKDYVIISKGNKFIDTVSLDKNNFFNYQIKSLESGVYSFSHNEYQAFFIEPCDSILLRVNTIEFDESLSYTGKGAEKNNLIMEMFLMNEQENFLMPSWYSLSPNEYEKKIDSLSNIRNNLYNQFKEAQSPSKAVQEIVEASIKYDLYSKKELYIAAISRKQVLDSTIRIPDDFLSFRNHINLGNENLQSYYPYYRYLSYYLDNLAFDSYKLESPYNRDSFVHNYHKLILINRLITSEELKNILLRNNVNRYFINTQEENKSKEMLTHYLQLSSNEKDKSFVKKKVEAIINLMPKHTLPNTTLFALDKSIKDLHSIINTPTVLFFWSDQHSEQYRNIHNRVNQLKLKFPDYNFIGINTDIHYKRWLNIVTNNNYDNTSEYQLKNVRKASSKLIVGSANRVIIVDKDATILSSNNNIHSAKIERDLFRFLN